MDYFVFGLFELVFELSVLLDFDFQTFANLKAAAGLGGRIELEK